MLTDADIPPGGEGKIDVTFDTSHKKGQEKKSITVESNDPRNPRATLRISALVEIVFGFEEYSVDVGKIRKGQPVSKTATLVVKDPSTIKTIKFSSSSPYISAKVLNTPVTDKSRLTVEISGTSEMPVGRIDATITGRAGDSAASEATLQIRGAIVGNLDISPEAVQFRVDTSKHDPQSVKQVVRVVGTADDIRLHILDIKDADQRLTFHIDTLLVDKQYEISMAPQPAVFNAGQNVAGIVTITTDDMEQPVMSVNYHIYFVR